MLAHRSWSGHSADVSLGEIIAFEEERLTGDASQCVGKDVSEIELRGVAPPAEAPIDTRLASRDDPALAPCSSRRVL
jgi:hypothetical protein